MPHSIHSKYQEIDEIGVKSQKERWHLIEKSLLIDFESSYQFETAVKTYNSRYKDIWDFSAFHFLVNQEMTTKEKNEFFNITLPAIINLALRINNIIKCGIPLLKQGMNHSISMSQEQVACLLANAFLCTFPWRNTTKKNSEFSNYPVINFARLFASNEQKSREKIKCILNYFRRVTHQNSYFQNGLITFERRSLQKFNIPNWDENSDNLSIVKYHVSASERIETASGCLQVDFANKFVGGGVLGSGSVQEEIRFVINPELIVAKLFTECLADGEALIITGTEQFNLYSGYASSFKFEGNYTDTTPFDNYKRRKCRIVAIDALNYRNYQEQFNEKNLVRDLNKAYVGFSNNRKNDVQPVATGFWGAGAFQGHPIKSALIQFMICCVTRRNLIFYTFGDEVAEVEVAEIFNFLSIKKVTVKKLFNILKHFKNSPKVSEVNELSKYIKMAVESSTLNDRFKQKSILSYTEEKKFIKEEDFADSRLSPIPTTSSERNSEEVKIPFFNSFPQRQNVNNNSPNKPQRSLLESLDDDFKKN